MTSSDMLSIYVHWPFCIKKCPYCSFNSHVYNVLDFSIDEWIKAYCAEIEHFVPFISGKKVSTVFFGGGTPSIASPELICRILEKLAQHASICSTAEISLEANPSSVEIDKMVGFRNAGINRISLGVQSFSNKNLQFLGRLHDAQQAISAINIIAKTFDNYSLDLIYALPGQSMDEWLEDLTRAINLAQGHLSLYQLSIDEGTKFHQRMLQGEIVPSESDHSAEMYYTTKQILEQHGFEHYEVSNFARYGMQCAHNNNYWSYGSYLGIGPGAHSRITDSNNSTYAIKMICSPMQWKKAIFELGCGIESKSILSSRERAVEFMAMNMRTNRGIDLWRFSSVAGSTIACFVNYSKLQLFLRTGYINYNNRSLVVAEDHRLVTDHILSELLL